MDYYDMLKQVDAVANGLSEWEIEFIESLMDEEPSLTAKQQAVIDRLYDTHVVNRGIRK